MTLDGQRDNSVQQDSPRHCPLPQIPRQDWSSHPNFPTQALLLGSHKNFRRISRYLIEQVQQSLATLETPESTPNLAWRGGFQLYMRWIMAMRSHEHYEEAKLYPYLTHRYGLETRVLEEEHEALHALDEAVRSAFSAASQVPDSAETLGALQAALEAHDDALRQHLIDEEDAVIPLLLSLPRDEFVRYYEGHINELVARSQACSC